MPSQRPGRTVQHAQMAENPSFCVCLSLVSSEFESITEALQTQRLFDFCFPSFRIKAGLIPANSLAGYSPYG